MTSCGKLQSKYRYSENSVLKLLLDYVYKGISCLDWDPSPRIAQDVYTNIPKSNMLWIDTQGMLPLGSEPDTQHTQARWPCGNERLQAEA